MKLLFSSLLLLFFTHVSYSQSTPKAVMVKDAHIALNGTINGAFGGNSKATIEVVLPRNTVEWYYSFTTSRNQQSDQNLSTAIGFTTKIASLLASSYTAGASVKFEGLAENAVKSIVIPGGSIPVNTYVTDNYNAQLFTNGKNFNPYIGGTNIQSISGSSLIRVNPFNPGVFYIALYNPNATSGVVINVEVTATVLENQNSNLLLFNRSNLIGKWKDENSTITLQDDGKIRIVWDNQRAASGLWKLESDQLTFQLYKKDGTLSSPDIYTLMEANGFTFKYKHQKTGIIYTAIKQV